MAIGMFLTPIALVLRQSRGDIGALSPIAMLRGIGCAKGYLKITGAFWLAFAPAAIAFWSSLGHAIWLQIAIVGPLAVLPTFATARLLGTFTEVHRWRLGMLLYPSTNNVERGSPSATRRRPVQNRVRTATKTSGKLRVTATSPQVGPKRARPTKAVPPDHGRPTRSKARTKLPARPVGIEQMAARSTPQPGQIVQHSAGEPGATPTSRRSRPLRPGASKTPARPKPAPRQPAASRKPARPTSSPAVRTGMMDDAPDLSGIPGARVISHADRERYGATSQRD